MNDFETRLREVLDERSAMAPEPHGLADGARQRLRQRRTTWAVAAAAVVAAAVPVGLSQLGPDGTTGVADDPTVATSGLPPGVMEWGYRAESWHDVTFEVPVEWGYGGATAWCTVGETPDEALPLVSRPGSVTPAIDCSPGSGYGVTIGSAAAFDPANPSGFVWQYDTEGVDTAMYPDGAWLGLWYDTDTVVTVIAGDRATAQRLVDSVRRFEGADPNECPARLSEAEAEAMWNSTSDSFSICRYDEADRLTASRRFIGVDSQDVQTAILSAPIRRIDYDCPDPGPLPRTVLLQGGGYIGTVVTDSACEGDNGFFMSGVVREADAGVRAAVDLTRLP